MRCIYINLDRAGDRRARIEASFEAVLRGPPLERFAALGPEDVTGEPGALSPAEKACFRSHQRLIQASLADEGDLFVLEDDAVFAPRTFSMLEKVLAANRDWDLLFTEVGPSTSDLMMHMAREKQRLARDGKFQVLNLLNNKFFGSSAYVVNGQSKAKVHEALASAERLDRGYDLYVRDLCDAGTLRVSVCLPFMTTISADAATQVQSSDHAAIDRTLAVFRRLMFVDADPASIALEVADLSRAYSDGWGRMVGAILGVLASEPLPDSR